MSNLLRVEYGIRMSVVHVNNVIFNAVEFCCAVQEKDTFNIFLSLRDKSLTIICKDEEDRRNAIDELYRQLNDCI